MCMKPMWAAVTESFGFARYAALSAVSDCGIWSYAPPWSVRQNRVSARSAAGVRVADFVFSGADQTARVPQPPARTSSATAAPRTARDRIVSLEWIMVPSVEPAGSSHLEVG